jgi:cytochrome c553
MLRSLSVRRLLLVVSGLFLVALVAACAGSPTAADATPTAGPSQDPATATSLTFTADVQPILNNDCLTCHGNSRAENGYNFTTYAGVTRAVTAGSASSLLVRVTQPGGIMYQEFRGSAAAKAETIRRWVVDFKAAQ